LRLLLDELYSKEIAEQLRERGHDVLAVSEVPDLVSVSDEDLIDRAAKEGRAILTNNAGDFVPPIERSDHYGLVLTSDRSLPRSRNTIGLFVRLIDEFMSARPDDDALVGRIHWLAA
jgi:hypothetical protein